MPPRGRKPKPTSLRVLDGDHHKSRYNTAEPQFGAPVLEPPAYIVDDPEALTCWKWAVDCLDHARIISEADYVALEVLATLYAAWRQNTGDYKLIGQMRSMLAEFGFTPSSRTRIIGHAATEEPDGMKAIVGG